MTELIKYHNPVQRIVDQSPEMSPNQLMIVKAKNRLPIKSGGNGSQINEALDRAAIKVGVTMLKPFKDELFEFVLKNYPNNTPDEITTAFTLLCTGDLDEYLADSRGQVPQHYGQLNAMYFGKVMAAYLQFAQDQLKPLYLGLKEPELEPIDPNESKRIAVTELAMDILNHGEKGLPKTMRERRVFDWFVAAELVPPIPNFDEENKTAQVRKLREERKIGNVRITEALNIAESSLVREHIESEFHEMFWNFEAQEIHDRLVGSL